MYLCASCDRANFRVQICGIWELIKDYVGDMEDQRLFMNRVLYFGDTT